MAKVLITGAAGFLGSHLAEYLLKQGHEVVGCDNLSSGYKDNIIDGIVFWGMDCLTFDDMKIATKDVDVVFHLAASPYEGLSVFSPYFVTENTYSATVSVLSAAIQNKVKRFVFASSMARYGEQEVPFVETMVPKPEDPYGIAKYASEMTIKNLAETHGVEYAIAVPHNIIGSRQRYDDPYRNVASIMVNRMLQGLPPIIYGDGEQKRCFSFVADVVEPLAKMGFVPEANGEIINLGPDNEFITINELAEEIAEIMDFKGKPIYVDPRPKEVRFAYPSADKARGLLGYEPKTKLRDGLQSIVDYVKKRGMRKFRYNIELEILNEKTPKTWSEKIM